MVLSFHSKIYSEFTKSPEKFKCLNFLFCYSVEQMQTKYMLSEKRSKNQISNQLKFLKMANLSSKFLSFLFGLFIIKMINDNLNRSIKFNNLYLNYFVITIKLIGYLFFLIVIVKYLLTVTLCFSELILSCLFLSNRLDDLTDELFELFSADEFKKRKSINQKILKFCQNYDTILKIRFKMEQHFDKTLNFLIVFFIFCIIYPTLIILDQNSKKMLTIFYASNYISLLFYLYSLTYFNSKFLDSVSFVLSFNLVHRLFAKIR